MKKAISILRCFSCGRVEEIETGGEQMEKDDVVVCNSCGFAHVWDSGLRIPTTEELKVLAESPRFRRIQRQIRMRQFKVKWKKQAAKKPVCKDCFDWAGVIDKCVCAHRGFA